MGKKARAKKERRQNEAQAQGLREEVADYQKSGFERFLLGIVYLGVYLALFTPLVISSKFYFPFVGPKSLYLMGCCQVVFFAWLLLAIYYKRYRPQASKILIAFTVFLIILILSSLLGVDSSRSFWSKFERMTGLLMWLHLFGFFLAVSSTFRKRGNWKKLFTVSVFVATLIACFSLLEKAGVQAFTFSGRSGSTLGNTSFLGTFLLFNVFLALYLFWQERKKAFRGVFGICIVLAILAMYYADARAAILSTVGGFGLIFLLFLSFKPKRKWLRAVGKLLLSLSVLVALVSVILLFVPDSFVRQKFADLATSARFVNWEMAWQGFSERPLLGWGPENYTVLFPKFFNSCLFTARCGGEIWFDRTHNVVLDTLATTGVLGLLGYLSLFGALFYVLGKRYFKRKSIGFGAFSIFIALPVAYFVQNLTVFDMPVSLMLFVLMLALGAFLATKEREKKAERKLLLKHRWVAVVLLFVFCGTFFEFVIQPARTDALVISSLRVRTSQERVGLYRKALTVSPSGKYQIRDFFAQHSLDVIRQNLETMPPEEARKELDFLASELEKTRQESPLDFRSILKLAHLYNVYALLDAGKLALAEQYGREAQALSPANQQAYWALAQTKLYQGELDAAFALAQEGIDLEPNWLPSYRVAVQVASFYGDNSKAEGVIQQAAVVNPQWETELQEMLAPTP